MKEGSVLKKEDPEKNVLYKGSEVYSWTGSMVRNRSVMKEYLN